MFGEWEDGYGVGGYCCPSGAQWLQSFASIGFIELQKDQFVGDNGSSHLEGWGKHRGVSINLHFFCTWGYSLQRAVVGWGNRTSCRKVPLSVWSSGISGAPPRRTSYDWKLFWALPDLVWTPHWCPPPWGTQRPFVQWGRVGSTRSICSWWANVVC